MERLRLTSVVATVTVVLLIASLNGCGDGDGSEPTRPLATADPAATFAPLVRLHPREDSFPMSARHFLSRSGLEWQDGPCRTERDITLSALPEPGANEPPLDPRRLGGVPGYEVTAYQADCKTPRSETYSSAMRTRLFDTEDRPRGLGPTEGFALDIAGDAEMGHRRLGADGALAGVPAYYAVEEAGVAGRKGLRISYWLLYGRGERRDLQTRNKMLIVHEGDWERLDVLLERVAGDRYRPKAVHFHSNARVEAVAWDEVERTGPSDTHPIAYARRRTHTLRPNGDCRGRCTDWRTWDRLRDVRAEPWYGYGGGWGAADHPEREVATGPLGPSPYELGPAPDDSRQARDRVR